MDTALFDSYGRQVRYLRLSLTDRCNLRCTYCCGLSPMKFIPHDAILRYEEMLTLINVAVDNGVEKLRLTGGEPLARKGVLNFIDMIKTKHPQLDIRLTTNATLLAPIARTLKELGVTAINVSLDSFNPQTYEQITGQPTLQDTLDGIYAAQVNGITVKINAVAMRMLNRPELPQFLQFAQDNSLAVRFIEFMPMGKATNWNVRQYWSAVDILEEAKQFATLTPVPYDANQPGPARLYRINNSNGFLGLITPLSNHFCKTCNRLRITADGKLRTCLFSDKEYRLTTVLRHKKLGKAFIARIFHEANKRKPMGYQILEQQNNAHKPVANKHMTAIGG